MHRRSRVLFRLLALLAVALAGVSAACVPEALPEGLSGEEAGAVRRELRDLELRIGRLRAGQPEQARTAAPLWPDADLYRRSVEWALRYEPRLAPADVELVRRALRRGRERADALAEGAAPWKSKRGKLVRGYVSAVDGSTQPYGLIVPAGYVPGRPMRLDVVLHGSTRPVGMSELRFLAPFDEGDAGGQAPDQDWLELRPLGRVENCYRWAGEADVFEAIEDVCRHYNVDRDRIVLRGMSMGASGTWHLGLKHPDCFVALGPYCGYVDTHQFSETPLPNFVKVGPLPPHQEKALHMLDSVDYAANAGVVPAVAAMGEKDVFFQAHVIMGQAMEREGLRMLNLISPGTGHVQDPVTWGEQMRRIGEHAARGRDRAPRDLRFVTWTLKYPRCHWVELLGLEEHYARAEFRGRLEEDGGVQVETLRNVTRFALRPPALRPGERLTVDGREVALPAGGAPEGGLVFARRGDRWRCEGPRERVRLSGKRPGLQGPIDDAFSAPFLLVRGTGTPWNPAVAAWADASLKRFQYEWSRYFRGDARVKDDTQVTPEDLARYHLVLFGDPGSNLWIRKALPGLPLRWTRGAVRLGGREYPAADHAPLLIAPSPLRGARDRYVVVNSGHTFRESELNLLNYLLFPRLGDWAVQRVGTEAGAPREETLAAGFFDEAWKLPGGQD